MEPFARGPRRAEDSGVGLQATAKRQPSDMSNNDAPVTQTVPGGPAQAVALYNLAVRLLGRYRETGEVEDLNRAVEVGRTAVDRTPPDHPERADRLTILGNVLSARFDRLGRRTDLDEAIVVLDQVVAMAPEHADRGGHLCNLAIALRRRDDTGDLNRAIILGRDAVRFTPPDHRHRPNVLTNLANSLHVRFDRHGDLDDLDQAIAIGRESVSAARENRHVQLTNLGSVLTKRFERTGNLADLEEAVNACRDAVERIPADSPGRGECLSNLGVALRMRYDRTGNPEDLDDAVRTLNAAIIAIPNGHPMRPGIWSNLGFALSRMFERTGDMNYLDRAVQAQRDSMAPGPNANHPPHKALNNLAGALRAHYNNTGNIDDLDEAIEAGRKVGAANLIAALSSRFQRNGDLADLDEAITVARQVIAADPADHPARGRHLSLLGSALRSRFQRTDDLRALDEAITVNRDSLAVTGADHTERASRLEHLGMSLRDRFERIGDLGDLDEAVEACRGAVLAAPSGHVMTRGLLTSLGSVLIRRYHHTGDSSSLKETIAVYRQALALTPANHPARAGQLANLGSALHALFVHSERLEHLEEAIALERAALAAIPEGHSARAIIQSNLGSSLRSQYQKTKDITRLSESLSFLRAAVLATPADDPTRASRLHEVSRTLWQRYLYTREIKDLAGATDIAEMAIAAIADDAPHQALYLGHLGALLGQRYRRTRIRGYAAKALESYRRSATTETASVRVRVTSSVGQGKLAATVGEWQQATDAFATAASLLPMLAARELSRSDQEHQLAAQADIATSGAASALNLDRSDLAVTLLEQGRGVLLSQVLETRGDLTDLRDHHPNLAQTLIDLNERLDEPGDDRPGDFSALDLDVEPKDGRGHRRDRHQIAHKRASLIAEIRGLPGFQRFLLPPDLEQLQSASQDGPVICCNVSSYRSDALVLTGNNIHIVKLPEVTPAKVRANVNRLLAASEHPERARSKDELDDVLHWLWDALASPVLESLSINGAPGPSEPWPRIWWVPTGLLSFLPIHAAGYHDNPDDPLSRTVIDRAISSYTPTIRALHHARERVVSGKQPSALVVCMPTTPAQIVLKAAGEEAKNVQSQLQTALVLQEENATRDRILAELPSFSWAHFACHAESDPDDPSNGQLLVHDYLEHPLTVPDISRLKLETAELAFLSACQTARTGLRLADESIHLTSAFQLAGYQHVIGTLWSIEDNIAAEIARFFYQMICQQNWTDSTRHFSAALHGAVRHVRARQLDMPFLWAAHIHVGC